MTNYLVLEMPREPYSTTAIAIQYVQIGNALVYSYNPTHSLHFPHYPDYAILLLTVYYYKNVGGHNQSSVLNIRLSLKRR